MKKTLILLLSLYSFMACEKEPDTKKKEVLETKVASNIFAGYSNYQLFSFATGDTLPITDSATTKWDIGLKGTTIIFNGGTSGPGDAGVIIIDALFAEVEEANSSGYIQDALTAKAIPTGSGNGWYNYDFNFTTMTGTHQITPLAGKVFVVRTANNKYAKFVIDSYYKDKILPGPDSKIGEKYYTFKYVYQPDGTRNLK